MLALQMGAASNSARVQIPTAGPNEVAAAGHKGQD